MDIRNQNHNTQPGSHSSGCVRLTNVDFHTNRIKFLFGYKFDRIYNFPPTDSYVTMTTNPTRGRTGVLTPWCVLAALRNSRRTNWTEVLENFQTS